MKYWTIKSFKSSRNEIDEWLNGLAPEPRQKIETFIRRLEIIEKGDMLMTSNKRKERLLKNLKDKRQRDAFVSAQIDTGIPFQIKVLREQKPWTQKELGEHINPIMDQVRISILEDPNY